MLKKTHHALLFVLSTLLSTSLFADSVIPEESSRKTEISRGQTITIDQLAKFAKLTSARDETGEPVALKEQEYTVGSFSRTTITIIPSGGDIERLITLDVLDNSPKPSANR